MAEAAGRGTRHAESSRTAPRNTCKRREFLHPAMALTLICPKCDGATELRGMLDVWYLTWCPECERLWRVELHSLLDHKPDVTESAPSVRRTRFRARPST